ncbi:MAG: hypothetical protein WCG93_12880 [Paludibacter sp.]
MKVLQGQTIFDIAVQSSGSAEAAYELALLNGVGLTDDLITGGDLIHAGIVSAEIAAYYASKQLMPATLMAQIIEGTLPVVLVGSLVSIENNTLKVLSGQTFFDLALQSSGNVEAAFELALLNELIVSDDLNAGHELTMTAIVNKQIANYYTNKNIKPATYITATTVLPENEGGIEFWAIETEFLVS